MKNVIGSLFALAVNARLALAFAILTSIGTTAVSAQSVADDLAAIINQSHRIDTFSIKGEEPPDAFTLERTSEVETAFLGSIRLYQATLSTQDSDVCNFHPSCSRFGVESIQRFGAVRGGLMAADRLIRDHGLPSLARHYALDISRGKFLDPVDRYRTVVTRPGTN